MPEERPTLVVVDSRVGAVDALIAELESAGTTNVEVIRLAPDSSGICQVSAILADHCAVSGLYIFPDRVDGGARLGTDWLTRETIVGNVSEISSWKSALVEGTGMVLHGCDLESTVEGRGLRKALAAVMSVEISGATTGDADVVVAETVDEEDAAVESETLATTTAEPVDSEHDGPCEPAAITDEAGTVFVTGSFEHTPNAAFRVEFRVAQDAEDAAADEGEASAGRPIGFAFATTDEQGMASFRVSLAAIVEDGTVITAVATDLRGKTTPLDLALAAERGEIPVVHEAEPEDEAALNEQGDADASEGIASASVIEDTGGTPSSETAFLADVEAIDVLADALDSADPGEIVVGDANDDEALPIGSDVDGMPVDDVVGDECCVGDESLVGDESCLDETPDEMVCVTEAVGEAEAAVDESGADEMPVEEAGADEMSIDETDTVDLTDDDEPVESVAADDVHVVDVTMDDEDLDAQAEEHAAEVAADSAHIRTPVATIPITDALAQTPFEFASVAFDEGRSMLRVDIEPAVAGTVPARVPGRLNLDLVNDAYGTATMSVRSDAGDGRSVIGAFTVLARPVHDGPALPDRDAGSDEPVLTVSAIPPDTMLTLNGSVLAVGDTFTAPEALGGRLAYVHSGTSGRTDSFRFIATDAEGRKLRIIVAAVIQVSPDLADSASTAAPGADGPSFRFVTPASATVADSAGEALVSGLEAGPRRVEITFHTPADVAGAVAAAGALWKIRGSDVMACTLALLPGAREIETAAEWRRAG